MNRKLNYIANGLIMSAFIIFSACGSTEDFDNGPSASEFYPLEVGNYWEYQVDTTYYDDDGITVYTDTSFVRELIVEEIAEPAGSKSYVLERSWKRNQSDSWRIVNLWKVRDDKGDIIRTEENLDFLTLKSPIETDNAWDGILFDERLIVTIVGETLEMFKSWDFRILDQGVSEQIGSFNYDNLLIVQQADDENLIERRFSVEKYEEGVGMVEKRQVILDTQCIDDCQGQSWTEKAERGFIMNMVLTDHN